MGRHNIYLPEEYEDAYELHRFSLSELLQSKIDQVLADISTQERLSREKRMHERRIKEIDMIEKAIQERSKSTWKTLKDPEVQEWLDDTAYLLKKRTTTEEQSVLIKGRYSDLVNNRNKSLRFDEWERAVKRKVNER